MTQGDDGEKNQELSITLGLALYVPRNVLKLL